LAGAELRIGLSARPDPREARPYISNFQVTQFLKRTDTANRPGRVRRPAGPTNPLPLPILCMGGGEGFFSGDTVRRREINRTGVIGF